MTKADFIGLKYFGPYEIIKTGASIADIDVSLIMGLECMRRDLGRKIMLLYNGLTTGDHLSEWHAKGLAADWTVDPADGPVVVADVFKAALRAGFKGIGAYWNGTAYSFHTDKRPDYAFWSGTKLPGEEWKMAGLILDPAKGVKNEDV